MYCVADHEVPDTGGCGNQVPLRPGAQLRLGQCSTVFYLKEEKLAEKLITRRNLYI
jgi:hypothetical protein